MFQFYFGDLIMAKPQKDAKEIDPVITAPDVNATPLTDTPVADAPTPPIDVGVPSSEAPIVDAATVEVTDPTIEVTEDAASDVNVVASVFKFKYSPINGVGNAILPAVQYSEVELEHLERFIGHLVIKEIL